MMTTTTANQSTPNRVERATSVVLSLLMLAGLPLFFVSVGVPFSGLDWSPVPGQLRNGIVPTEVITGVIVSAGWLLWALFAASFVQALFLARQGTQAQTRGIPGISMAARRLAAGLALAATPVIAAPNLAGAAIQPAVVDLQEAPSAELDAATTRLDQAEATERVPRVVAERHDSYMKIAERTLGDESRWQEIHQLNIGQTRPDGSTVHEGDYTIRAGQQVVLPADANVNPASAPGEDNPSGLYTVKEGDTFWGIAQTQLGPNATTAEVNARHLELVKSNFDRLTSNPQDENLIYPGDQFDIGVTATTGEPNTDADAGGLSAEADAAAEIARSTSAGADAELDAAAEIARSASAGVDADTETSASAAADDVGADSEVDAAAPLGDVPAVQPDALVVDAAERVDESPVTSPTTEQTSIAWERVAGIGVILAGLVYAVRKARKRRASERKTGHGYAPISEAAQSTEEAALRVTGSDEPDVHSLAVVASRGLREADVKIPDTATVVAIVSSKDVAKIEWSEPVPSPRCHYQYVTDKCWSLSSPDAAGITGTDIVPALATVGVLEDKTVALNVEALRDIDVKGPEALDTLRFMAVELCLSNHADDCDVYAVGFPEGFLPRLERLDEVETSEASSLMRRAAAHAQSSSSPVASRIKDVVGQIPIVVICADPAEVRTLRDARLEGSAVTIVALGDHGADWHLDAEAETVFVGGDLQMQLQRPALADEQYQDLEGLLGEVVVAEQTKIMDTPAALPSSQWAPEGVVGDEILVPSSQWAPDDELYVEAGGEAIAAGVSAEDERTANLMFPSVDFGEGTGEEELVLQVLGPVALADTTLTPKALELVALLASEGPLTRQRLCLKLWGDDPDSPTVRERFKKHLGRTRTALGETGVEIVYDDQTETYTIEGLCLDVDVVEASVEAFDPGNGSSVAALHRAVELICDEPYSGRGCDFAWRNNDQAFGRAQRVADDAARILGGYYKDRGDFDNAEWALRQGLKVCNPCDELYALLIPVIAAKGADLTPLWGDINAAYDDDPPARVLGLYDDYRGVVAA